MNYACLFFGTMGFIAGCLLPPIVVLAVLRPWSSACRRAMDL